MKTRLITTKLLQQLLMAALLLAGMAVHSWLTITAEASSVPVLQLQINGGSSAAIVNGQPVTLTWYIDGPVTDCAIDNGVGPIDTSVLPAIGSAQVTATDNDVTYVLSCNEAADDVVVVVRPTVNISLPDGNQVVFDPNVTGYSNTIRVQWSTSNATRCDDVYWREADNPTVAIFSNTAPATSGTLTLTDVFETTTYYITCYNEDNGTEQTDQVTLEAVSVAAPEAPAISLWTSLAGGIAPMSEVYGIATADVRFTSSNTDRCYFTAQYLDGTTYTPSGWGAGSHITALNFTNIKLATTTDFTIRCVRDEVTLSNVTHPGAETQETIRITVQYPAGVTSLEDWDRTTIPAVTATVAAPEDFLSVVSEPTTIENPVYVERSLVNDRAYITLKYWSANASYCNLSAKGLDGDPLSVSGWSGHRVAGDIGGAGATAFVNIGTSTTFVIYCYRQIDLTYGNPAEIEQGTEQAEVTVIVEDSPTAMPDPITYMYANPYLVRTDVIRSIATELTGFALQHNLGYPFLAAQNPSTNNRATFPFNGESGTYDIAIGICDEPDGYSDFRLYTAASGLVGSYRSEYHDDGPNACTSWSNYERFVIAENVSLTNGESVTIECDTDAINGEFCRIWEVFFHQGNQGTIVAERENPYADTASIDLVWESSYTSQCLSAVATRDDGSTYSWTGSSERRGRIEQLTISTSTTFARTCLRNDTEDELLEDTSWVRVELPPKLSLTAEALLSAGECIDENTLSAIDAPDGYVADSVTGICTPAVDLAVGAVTLSGGGTDPDGVAGMYGTLLAQLTIENLGPSALAVDDAVPYVAVLQYDDQLGLGFSTSTTGTFDAGLAAPPLGGSTESPTLSRTFADVPYGRHTVYARVNLDDTGAAVYPEASTNLANNIRSVTIDLPVPRPPMHLTADRNLVRRGQTTVVTWSAHTSYPMDCEFYGAGGIRDSFDASQNHLTTGAYENSVTAGPFSSTGDFLLQCTEPTTGDIFTERISVEVVPDSQEL